MKYNNFQAQQHEYGEILHFVQHFSFKLNFKRRMLYFVQDFWDFPSSESKDSHSRKKEHWGNAPLRLTYTVIGTAPPAKVNPEVISISYLKNDNNTSISYSVQENKTL
ncbi:MULTISPECIES: hypothetical protein [unclassified Paenibacillus]|jgi:hypothetical protein|uniref:hypothetical protein n=1 Tax=unclassified Paenibacillus TaxID=185978 RepID=UPI0004F683B2|nr:hypothetical protein [Paenibacillus sp. FSL P4-0081]AIQ30156.1 hypothetical protein P40081_19875 [Paenibacillus sp. FSL P4-0081]